VVEQADEGSKEDNRWQDFEGKEEVFKILPKHEGCVRIRKIEKLGHCGSQKLKHRKPDGNSQNQHRKDELQGKSSEDGPPANGLSVYR